MEREPQPDWAAAQGRWPWAREPWAAWLDLPAGGGVPGER